MAKQTINEYIGIGLLLSPNFDVSKFTSSDLRVFINSARKKIKQLMNYEEKLETRLRNTYQTYYTDSELRELERWFIETKEESNNE